MKSHPDANVTTTTIGREKAPLMIIDRFVSNAEELVEATAGLQFTTTTRFFPGVRAEAAQEYAQFLVEELRHSLFEFFRLRGSKLSLSMCHYSFVTTPPDALVPMQRIPHIDSVDGNGLATIHYLFRKDFGGTAFYRHRKTGYEYVDASRMDNYFDTLRDQLNGPESPPAAYINGATPLFEQVQACDAQFNRLLVYRRNSLHSGSVGDCFKHDTDPRNGRLSINSFIDVS